MSKGTSEEQLPKKPPKAYSSIPSDTSLPKWVDNKGNEVEEVFGFNPNAELVNGRAAMFGFLMLILTELVYQGVPITKSIFGIG